ncbi:MAG: hypothetical protein JJLCMIEE_00040 [Acidimicrobiales bacterium]|nr:MAG: RDD family protein [Actinomycetota bacterium]MBV6507003.1 hypothetical protein [Acidimicrobiales bacterium]RIK05814.1 MAG: hypothetical protein DCC48_09100 [Acidobacteriota bacterium]
MQSQRLVDQVEARDWHGYYAGAVSRYAAWWVDGIASVLLFYAIVWFGILVLGLFDRDYEMPDAKTGVWAIVFSGWVLVYLWGCWTMWGKTVGKALLGLRVVRDDGGPLGPGRSAMRVIGYLVSAAVFMLGFIWIMFSKERRGWHDHIAKSAVVYDWDARPGALWRRARHDLDNGY